MTGARPRPIPRGHGPVAGRSRSPMLGGVALRWRTWRRAHDLDRELAHGVDPTHSDELSLRAGQLDSAESKARLARALRGAVELADRQPDTRRTPPIRCKDIRASRELLLELAEGLDMGRPLGVKGLAMTSQLVHDAPGPLYRDGASRSLKAIAFEALIALERGTPTRATPTPAPTLRNAEV